MITDYLKYQHPSLVLVKEFKAVYKTRSSFKVNMPLVSFPNEDTVEPLKYLNQVLPVRLGEIFNSASEDPLAQVALAKLLLI